MIYTFGILALVALQALTTSALPPCVCTRNLRPVCGSDGKTYSNECLLNCEKFKGNTDLTVEKDGPCQAAEQICICTYEYKPVCGNDGNTYPNRCSMLCKRSSNPDIDVVSEGACTDEVKVAEPPCICTEELNEVCGTDGNTYPNPCTLNCATAKNPSLGVKNSGKCDNSILIVEPIIADPSAGAGCSCPRNLKPVCGSDGQTYNNECLLRCSSTQATLAKNAPCE